MCLLWKLDMIKETMQSLNMRFLNRNTILKWIKSINILNMKWSRLELGRSSYTRILSFCSKQKPRSLTKFLCWSLETNLTSFLNSCCPCLEFINNLLTAICFPLSSMPWYIKKIRKPSKQILLNLKYMYKRKEFESYWSFQKFLPYIQHQIHLDQAY